MVKEATFISEYSNGVTDKFRLEFNFIEDYVVVHHTIDGNVTHNVIKEMLLDFENIKTIVSGLGIKHMVVMQKPCDGKLKKYWKLMGFTIVDNNSGYMGV